MAYYTSAKQGVHGNFDLPPTKTHGVKKHGKKHSALAAKSRKKSSLGKKQGY